MNQNFTKKSSLDLADWIDQLFLRSNSATMVDWEVMVAPKLGVGRNIEEWQSALAGRVECFDHYFEELIKNTQRQHL